MNISCPLLVDFMEDKANKAYGALPERIYVLMNGKIAYMGGQGPFGYKIMKLKIGWKITNSSESWTKVSPSI